MRTSDMHGYVMLIQRTAGRGVLVLTIKCICQSAQQPPMHFRCQLSCVMCTVPRPQE